MVSANEPTLLVLEGIGVPRYSARGLHQTLAPIDAAAHIERTINGELIDLGNPAFRKYKSTITGTDQMAPACDGVWPGQIVTVECIAELCHPEYAPFGRPPVNYDTAVRYVAGFLYYRPRLEMRVMAFSMDEDEYGRVVSWSMDLEEI